MRNFKVSESSENIEMENSQESSIFNPTNNHVCAENCVHSVAESGDDSKLSDLVDYLSRTNFEKLNERDKNGRTPLHFVNSIKCNCVECLSHAETRVRCLLCHGIDIDCQDSEGNTPLHLAIQYGNTVCAKLLIDYGADVSIKNYNGQTCQSLIAKHCPEVMVAVLNRAVNVEKSYPNSKDCVLRLDFGAVTGYPDPDPIKSPPPRYYPELSLLSSTLHTNKTSRQIILTHPLIVLFLDQKWRRVKKYVVFRFLFYLFWLLAYTSYIIHVYLVSCPCEYFTKTTDGTANKSTKGENEKCKLLTGFTSDALIVILLTLLMAISEVLKIIASPHLYLKNKVNIGSWILIFMVFITIGPVIMENDSKPAPWQYQAASVGIFLSWAFILGQLGSFPTLGRYVEILGHVLKNFSLSMLTFSSLFMAFALSFNVLFPGRDQPFSHFFYAIIKCIVMFAGEIDYQDMFYDSKEDHTTGPIVGHILYAGFILIVSIVLMNLLVGLTVSDIHALQKEAELTRIFRQISELISIESTCFSSRLPRRISIFLQRQVSVTCHKKHAGIKESFMLRIRPNDPKDKVVPEYLKETMLKIAVNNYHNKAPIKDRVKIPHTQSEKSVHFTP